MPEFSSVSHKYAPNNGTALSYDFMIHDAESGQRTQDDLMNGHLILPPHSPHVSQTKSAPQLPPSPKIAPGMITPNTDALMPRGSLTNLSPTQVSSTKQEDQTITGEPLGKLESFSLGPSKISGNGSNPSRKTPNSSPSNSPANGRSRGNKSQPKRTSSARTIPSLDVHPKPLNKPGNKSPGFTPKSAPVMPPGLILNREMTHANGPSSQPNSPRTPTTQPQAGISRGLRSNVQESMKRKALSILNKISIENLDSQTTHLLEQRWSEYAIEPLCELIYEKAISEPKYSAVYATLCAKLAQHNPSFKRMILRLCQTDFENRQSQQITANDTPEWTLAKNRMRGNIIFVGELFRSNLINRTIIFGCFNELLASPDWMNIEALCKLMSSTGKLLDYRFSAEVDQYFSIIEQFSRDLQLNSRIRFMLLDLIELRSNDWIPRNQRDQPLACCVSPKLRSANPHRRLRSSSDKKPPLGKSRWTVVQKSYEELSNLVLKQSSSALGSPTHLPAHPAPTDATSVLSSLESPESEMLFNDLSTSLTNRNPTGDERLERLVHITMEELYGSMDFLEALACLEELKVPVRVHPKIVEFLLGFLFKANKSADVLVKLIFLCWEKSFFSSDAIQQGISLTLSTLEDAVEDLPEVPKRLGYILAQFYPNIFPNFAFLGQSLHQFRNSRIVSVFISTICDGLHVALVDSFIEESHLCLDKALLFDVARMQFTDLLRSAKSASSISSWLETHIKVGAHLTHPKVTQCLAPVIWNKLLCGEDSPLVCLQPFDNKSALQQLSANDKFLMYIKLVKDISGSLECKIGLLRALQENFAIQSKYPAKVSLKDVLEILSEFQLVNNTVISCWRDSLLSEQNMLDLCNQTSAWLDKQSL